MTSKKAIRNKILISFPKQKMKVLKYAELTAKYLRTEKAILNFENYELRVSLQGRNYANALLEFYSEIEQILNKFYRSKLFKSTIEGRGLHTEMKVSSPYYYQLHKSFKFFKVASAELLELIENKILKSEETMEHNYKTTRRIDRGLVVADFLELDILIKISRISFENCHKKRDQANTEFKIDKYFK